MVVMKIYKNMDRESSIEYLAELGQSTHCSVKLGKGPLDTLIHCFPWPVLDIFV